jgi:hypothetical protein
MAQQWYVKTKSGETGPFSAGRIKKFIVKGKLRPSTHIRVDGRRWKKASSVKGLKDLFADAIHKKESEPSEPVPKKSEPGSCLIQQREKAYAKQFGPFDSVSHPIVPGEPHIDVYIHKPTDARPFNTLVTGGMSDHAMAVPDNGPASPRCELVLYVHRVEEHHIELLRFLASQPYLQKTWFSYGSTLNNGTPPKPIFDDSTLDHFVFMFPVIGTDFDFHKSVSIEGSPLQLLHVEPITLAERKFIVDSGLDAFLDLLEKKQHLPLLNPERKCYVKKSWFGR